MSPKSGQRKLKAMFLLVALCVAVAVLAGCGGGGSSSGSTESTQAEEGTTATTEGETKGSTASGSPVKIMVISSDNSQFYNLPVLWGEAEGFAGQLNAEGGLNGHPLEIIDCNDQAEPDKSARCAREAASKHVVAMVGGVTTNGDKMFPILEAANIPWVGNNPLSASDYTSEFSFPTTPNPFQYALSGQLAANECKSVNAIVDDVAINVSLLEEETTFGLKAEDPSKSWGKTIKVPPETTDFTPYAAQVTEGNPECVYMMMPEEQQEQFVQTLEQVGQSPTLVSNTASLSQTVIDAGPVATDGAHAAAGFPVPTSPLWDHAKEAIADYSDVSEEESSFDEINQAGTWVGLTAFAEVAKMIKGEITSESLIAALHKAKDVNTGELTLPIDFTKEYGIPAYRRLFNTSVWAWNVENEEFVAKGNAPVDMAELFKKGYEVVKGG